MDRFAAALFAVFVLSVTGSGQVPCNIFSQIGSVFQFCVPAGIKATPVAKDQRFPTFVRDTDLQKNRFVLSITEEPTEGSQMELAYTFITGTYSDPSFKNLSLKQIGEFKTDSGIKAFRHMYEFDSLWNTRTRQIQYIFTGPGAYKIVFIVLIPAAIESETALADAIIRTVTIRK